MSFTCPDCLWTSHHPRDEQENFCGHCHDFKSRALQPTEFQYAACRGILSQFPLQNLWLAISFAQARNMSLAQIYLELAVLGRAALLTSKQFAAVQEVINEITQTPDTILSSPMEPFE